MFVKKRTEMCVDDRLEKISFTKSDHIFGRGQSIVELSLKVAVRDWLEKSLQKAMLLLRKSTTEMFVEGGV
ncbi:hypothetical protein [Ahrensia marina]|uniref:Uncharacterized protein n=1 Tax=Ahrensia marina TaxID=1514904 RepID=A0A0N0E6D2_9HYPH|nr:hypothetical protein [Ahrensia marina]KPA99894.1 hypothetical protein SU32_16740 [Ahrensia marina]